MLYVAVAPQAVSAVLVYQAPKEEGGQEMSVYYVSKTLVGARCDYIIAEKLLFAILMAS